MDKQSLPRRRRRVARPLLVVAAAAGLATGCNRDMGLPASSFDLTPGEDLGAPPDLVPRDIGGNPGPPDLTMTPDSSNPVALDGFLPRG